MADERTRYSQDQYEALVTAVLQDGFWVPCGRMICVSDVVL
jgi:hypothetical protein